MEAGVMRRTSLAVLACISLGCVTLTPAGKQVGVYFAPLAGPASLREMPADCRRLSVTPNGKNWMSESEIEGQGHPFFRQQNASAVEGGNVLLVLKEVARPRLNPECPNQLPIRDCPGYSGAWFNVVFESYTCTPDAIRTLNTPRK
jgi:hypothetical protein